MIYDPDRMDVPMGRGICLIECSEGADVEGWEKKKVYMAKSAASLASGFV